MIAGVLLKKRLALFLKIQAVAFVIGTGFILRNTANRVIEEQQRAVNLGMEPPFASTLQEALGRVGQIFLTEGWLILLPLYGTCLFFLRVDQRIKGLRQAFVKWSVLFLVMEFTTEWTKYGWTEATAELPLMLIRYLAGGALAAAVWWLIERSPRVHETHGRGHH
jgi:hypothetical protein